MNVLPVRYGLFKPLSSASKFGNYRETCAGPNRICDHNAFVVFFPQYIPMTPNVSALPLLYKQGVISKDLGDGVRLLEFLFILGG